MTGFVYVAEFGDVIKIGRSVSPEKRVAGLSLGFGQKASKVYFREFSDPVKMERLILRSLSEFLRPAGGVKRETFAYPFNRAKDGIQRVSETKIESVIKWVEDVELRKLSKKEVLALKESYLNSIDKSFIR